MPGKSEITLQEYEETFKHLQQAGVKVFSVLIAGLESEPDTLAGVKFLARLGVPTNLLCFRPFSGTTLGSDSHVNPAWFLEITQQASLIMQKYEVLETLSRTVGCGSCGGCSMEMNLHRFQATMK